MSVLIQSSSRLTWLYAALGKQYGRIEGLLRRMTGIAPDPLKPGLFRKFAGHLQQIALEKDDVHRTIREIEAIERKHRFMRLGKKLKKAGPAIDYGDEPKPEYERNWLWFWMLWMMLMRGPSPAKAPQIHGHANPSALMVMLVLKIVIKSLLANKHQMLKPKNGLLRFLFSKIFVPSPSA